MMPTTVSHPRSPGRCLDDLLASRFLPRRWAGRIQSASELPSRLAQCANKLAPTSEWRAYGDQDEILFAIARAHAAPRADTAAVAIDVYFLDDRASVYSAGVWEYDSERGWWLDAILDLSYDTEHGWWLDVLMDPPIDAQRATCLPRALQVRRLRSRPKQPARAPSASRAARRHRESM
jgi:hypothetical protein